MTFKPNFYYLAMAINVICRFWWLIYAIVMSKKHHSIMMENLEFFVFIGMMIEAVRRTLWCIIRVENEFFNNFEHFRDIVQIPPIKD